MKVFGLNLLRRLLPPETVEVRLKPRVIFRGPVKIIAINGSLRGEEGAGAKLLNDFLAHVRDFGGQVQTITLAEKNIFPCAGCVSQGQGRCTYPCVHRDDDTNSVLQALINADAFVFMAPNYWAGVSSHLQLLLEKMTAIEENHYAIAFKDGREPLFGKPVVLLCSQEGEGASMTLGRLSWALNHMGVWVLPWGMIFKPALLNRGLVRFGMRVINERKFEWVDNTLRVSARNLVCLTAQLKELGYQWDDYKIIEPNC